MKNRTLHVFEQTLFDAIRASGISSEERLNRVKSSIKAIKATQKGQATEAMSDENKPSINAANSYGFTALICAAAEGYQDIVHELIEAGADCNKQNNFGDTALDIAMNKKNLAMVNLLLSHNAKVKDVHALHRFLKANHIVSPPYVTSAAFEPALEIKEDKGSPSYGAGIACIEKYPKTG